MKMHICRACDGPVRVEVYPGYEFNDYRLYCAGDCRDIDGTPDLIPTDEFDTRVDWVDVEEWMLEESR